MRHHAIRRLYPAVTAGMVGTAVIEGLQLLGQKKAPEQMPPMKQHPGEYMVEKVEEQLPRQAAARVPRRLEQVVAQLLGVGYGLGFAALYGLVRPKRGKVLLEGSLLGLVTWAAGYLGWLPRTGLMPPLRRQRKLQVVGAILSHLAYGLATAGTLRGLRRRRSWG